MHEKALTISGVAREAVVKWLNVLSGVCHANSEAHGFYDNGSINHAEKIALMHSELSEALEAMRKPDKKDEHLPDLNPVGLELADVLIRIFDYCGATGIDIGECLVAKHNYNVSRPHKHGKAF